MRCPSCDKIIADDSKTCENCGAEIAANNTDNPSKKRSLILKIIVAAAAVLVIIAVVLIIINTVNASRGENAANLLSDRIGSSIARAEEQTGLELDLQSRFDYLSDFHNYDFIYESEKTVKINGVHIPEWAVYVECDENQRISTVSYCDYRIVKSNTKGERVPDEPFDSRVDYGMTVREVQKSLGISPYAIVSDNDDTTSYIYRYYTVDEETQNEKGYFLTVEFSLEGQVINIYTDLNSNGIDDLRL